MKRSHLRILCLGVIGTAMSVAGIVGLNNVSRADD
jgi:hypothetical protein